MCRRPRRTFEGRALRAAAFAPADDAAVGAWHAALGAADADAAGGEEAKAAATATSAAATVVTIARACTAEAAENAEFLEQVM